MTNDPLDLWPDDIQVAPLTPLSILRYQAQRLRKRTNGLLAPEVISATTSSIGTAEFEYTAPSGEQVTHTFAIVAPKLNNYRYQMFACTHDARQLYPVYLEDDDAHDPRSDEGTAATQEELLSLPKRLFKAKRHRGAITSLLAQIAEQERAAVPA